MRIGLCFLIPLAVIATAPAAPADSEWMYDVVRLKSGSEFRGMIVEESPAQVKFVCVRRRPGRPTVCFPTTFAPSELANIIRLKSAEREQLAGRLKALAEADQTNQSRLRELDLVRETDSGPDVWWSYNSEQFHMRSNASEEIVRRAALRLEQISAAYVRYFPPRRPTAEPTSIVIYRDRDGYEELLKSEGRAFVNTGFYDRSARRIVCASDIDSVAAEVESVRRQHKQIRSDLDRQEAALEKLYHGAELLRHIQPIRDMRGKIDKSDKQNAMIVDQVSRRFLAKLYHERFHAYLDAFVYAPDELPVPRWLNEGLAQVFETAIVEAGELRVGHVGPNRLNRIKDLVRTNRIISIIDLAPSGEHEFVAELPADRAEVNTFYLSAWAWAHYLTFEKRISGTPAFTAYLRELKQGREPSAAFAALLGEDLAAAQQSLNRFLLKLQTDGTTAELPGGRK